MLNLHLLTRLTHRCAAFALVSAALTAASAGPAPLVPPPTFLRHVPAPPPAHNAQTDLRVAPPVPSGAYFAPGVPTPTLDSAWQAPPQGLPPMTVFTLGVFTGIGPAPIQFGQTQGNASPVSGRVAALAADPTNPNIFYVAAAGGGVWKTTDNGATYTVLTDALPDLAMGALAVAPSNPDIVYAGSGEANYSGDSRYGGGVYVSTDGGSSWTVYTGPNNAFYRNGISKIVVDPTNADTVYLTTSYDSNGAYGNWGIWKSVDGGHTWAYSFSVDPSATTPFTDLVIDPSTPQTLYAAAGSAYGGSRSGIYKSTDGAATWTLLTGFPYGAQTGEDVGRIVLALAPSDPQTLYASYSSHGNNGDSFGALVGMYRTTNGGAAWTMLPNTPNYLGGQGWYDDALAVSPTNASQVFAVGTGSDQVIVSQDGGNSWTAVIQDSANNGPHTDHHALAFNAAGSLLDGNDGGVWRMDNPGTANFQWVDRNTNLATIQFTGIALDPLDPNTAYGGSQDNGTEKFGGTSAWNLIRYGDGGFVRVDQSNPQTIYHEYYGLSLERSEDGGNTWAGATSGVTGAKIVPDGSVAGNFYMPYILDPGNQSRILLGTDRVNESTDQGNSFHALSMPNTNGFNPNDYNIDALGVNGSTIYASAGGTVYVTTNNGASWTARPISGDTDSQSDIYVNPANAQEAIVTRPRFNGGPGSHVFHTLNGGATWTDISGNLPDEPFNAVKREPSTGTLYVGGDDGVYLSTNGGGSWSKAPMPNAQVTDLAVSPGANLVGAGTHGRGMFETLISNAVSAPYDLTAVAAYSQIVLNWDARASANETYNVYRGTTPGGESATPLATGITTDTYTDTTPVNGVTYYYTVKMVIGGSVSGPSNEASATGTTGPPTLYVPSASYPTIQSAITAAGAGYTVQVADGTYSGPGNVDLDFGGKNITVQSQHGAAKTTIECGGSGTAAHRGFDFHTGETGSAVVSGFTIQHADGTDEGAVRVESGSGPTIQNCVFLNNTSNGSGAGLFNNGTVTVTNCVFTGNVASGGYQSGAGIFSNGTLTALDCLFTGNNAANYGGGIGVGSGSASVTNCVFSGNTANQCGAILNFGTLTLTNCTSTQNTANYRAVYNGGTATLVNDILFNDFSPEIDGNAATATFSDIQQSSGTYAGTGNINADPLFVNPPTDLHLQAGSPCLGAGTASGAPTTTIDGYTRPNPPSMGAYEAALSATSVTVANVTGAAGQTVTLAATLSKTGGAGLSGKTLSFSVDSATVGTAVTNSSGVATLSYVIPANAAVGSHKVAVTFAGDSGDAASSGTGTLTVTAANKLNTVVTVGARTGAHGTTVSLKAYLKTSAGSVLSGRTLTYTVNGAAAGSAVTDSTGLATLSYAIPASAPAGNEPIVVSFAGDSGDNPSTGNGTLTVTGSALSTSVTVAAVSGAPGQTVSLSATLKAGTTLLSGKTLTFKVDTATVGTAVTNSSGVASLSYAIPANANVGSHTVVVSFAGDSGDAASSGTGTLTVTGGSKVNTVVTVGARSGKAGTTVSLKAYLKTSGGAALVGKTLTYTVNGVAAGSAVTDSTGLATLTYTIPANAPAGNEPIVVTFGGDGGDNAGSGKGTLTVS